GSTRGRGRDAGPPGNVEALFTVGTSFYTYDRPKTNLDVNVQYYPSLSDIGRHRVQLDVGVRRDFWRDFFVGAKLFNTYDNRPPNPAANTNDVGIVLSIGWTY